MSQYLCYGSNYYGELFLPQLETNYDQKLDEIHKFEHEIIDLTGTFNITLVQISNKEFLQTIRTHEQESREIQFKPLEFPTIIQKIQGGGENVLVLARNGSVYIFNYISNYSETRGKTIGDLSPPRKIFNEKAKDIACGRNSFHILTDIDLFHYGGLNTFEGPNLIEDRDGLYKSRDLPAGIVSIWSGPVSYSLIALDFEGNVYVLGDNENVKLTIDNKRKVINWTKIKIPEPIKKAGVANMYSLVLSTTNNLYLLRGRVKLIELKSKVIDFNTCSRESVFLTEDDEVYLLSKGESHYYEITKCYQFNFHLNLKISCMPFHAYVFENKNSNLSTDWTEFYKQEFLTDIYVGPLKAHSLLWNCRMNYPPSSDIDLNKASDLLLVIYSDIEIPGIDIKNSLNDGLLELYLNRNDTGDIFIIVENQYKLSAHKIVLSARCGFFNDLFHLSSDESNEIIDYSGIPLNSWEILLKFIYLGPFDDYKPSLETINNLEDAEEYFQINNFQRFINRGF